MVTQEVNDEADAASVKYLPLQIFLQARFYLGSILGSNLKKLLFYF
jgi:hypothetical protein